MDDSEIHLIIRQVGSAYPMIEFANVLSKTNFKVKIFAYANALPVIIAAGLNAEKISNFSDYQRQINTKPRYIFTGTSECGDDDASFWSWAHKNDIISLAWLDQPVNLQKRFLQPV